MSRISKKFRELRRQGRKALIPFIVAGDPRLSATVRLVFALEAAGADVIELGVPFSDPMADGPVIQRASERALEEGVTLKKILRQVRELRRRSEIPIVLMGYYNPILAYGLERYARDAARAGVDGTLVVDLPPEESRPLGRELEKRGIDLIRLLAPTSDRVRVRQAVRRARGFVYLVSMTGVTGARLHGLASIRTKIREVRRQTRLPVVVGFGIQNQKQAVDITRFSDGVVVGSALVHRIGSSRCPERSVFSYLQRLRRTI